MAVGDAWFALGPALVFALAGAPDPRRGRVAAATRSRSARSSRSSSRPREARDVLHGGASLREQILESRWIYLVDALLAPVGLAFAFATVGRPWAMLLAAPLLRPAADLRPRAPGEAASP